MWHRPRPTTPSASDGPRPSPDGEGRTYARDVDPVIVLVAPEHADVLTDEFGRYARDYDVRTAASVAESEQLITDVLAGGARVDLRSLTSLGIGVEHQWRSGDRQLTRITLDVVQHF